MQHCLLLWSFTQKNKICREKASAQSACKTTFCCNSNLKKNEEWNIQGKSSSKMKSDTHRGKSIQVHTRQNCFLFNFDLKENEEWNIQGKKHSSAQSAKLLFVVILVWTKMKSDTHRGKKHSSAHSAKLLFV